MAYDQNLVHAFYKKLLTLYPPGFREQLGESMLQTFNDLCNEKQKTKSGLFSFVLWTIIETTTGIIQEHILAMTQGGPMKNILTNLRSPAFISLLLVLPFMVMEFMNSKVSLFRAKRVSPSVYLLCYGSYQRCSSSS